MPERYKLTAAVYIVLIRDGKVLLIRRANTGYEDGNYGIPAGHMEAGETVRDTAVREAMEEVAVVVEPEDLTVAHTMVRKKSGEHDRDYVDFYLEAKHWAGEPKNNEPHKCDDIAWFPLDSLPENTSAHARQALDCIRRGQPFSECGW
jgi:8-oxo-dGTP diphosphatase